MENMKPEKREKIFNLKTREFQKSKDVIVSDYNIFYFQCKMAVIYTNRKFSHTLLNIEEDI